MIFRHKSTDAEHFHLILPSFYQHITSFSTTENEFCRNVAVAQRFHLFLKYNMSPQKDGYRAFSPDFTIILPPFHLISPHDNEFCRNVAVAHRFHPFHSFGTTERINEFSLIRSFPRNNERMNENSLK